MQKMNILFIYSVQDHQSVSRPIGDMAQMQLGISYISSVLKSHNHCTELLVLTRKTKIEAVDKFIRNFSADLICFTAVFSEYDFVARIARHVKEKFPSIYLLAGGPHVSLDPEAAASDSFDALCIGEGEYPTLELTEQLKEGLKPSGIKNLWIKNEEGIERNPVRSFNEDLDSLPFPDRNIWRRWVNGCSRQIILLGRGCPFQCTYCCNHAFKQLASGEYVRNRSVKNILEEAQEILLKFPETKRIYFEIESISIDKKFAFELCLGLEDFNRQYEKPLTYEVNLRISPNTDYKELFCAFKKANFSFVNLGLESGSDDIRREVLKRHYSNQDVIRAIKLAREYGLKTRLYVMLGIPDETTADFKRTIECVRECQPDVIYPSIFFPYPGTELHDLCRKKGLLNQKIDTCMERYKAVLDLPGFSRNAIQKEFCWFDYNVYKGHKPLSTRVRHVIYLKIRSNNYLNSAYLRFRSNSFLHSAYRRLKVMMSR